MIELIVGGVAAIAGIAGSVYAALAYHRRNVSRKPHVREGRGATIPRQSSSFVGRQSEIKEVSSLLASRNYLVEILGLGGVGKTALAIEVARTGLRDGLFEDVVWVSAKYQPVSLSAFVTEVLAAKFHPTNFEGKQEGGIELVRQELANSKTLVIVDNYEDVTDLHLGHFLRDLPPPSKALLTTRIAAVDGAARYSLQGLPEPDAAALAKAELSRHTDPALVRRLCACAHGIPFVIKWFAGQVRVGQDPLVLLSGLEAANLAAEELYDYIFDKTFGVMSDEELKVLTRCSLFRNPARFDDIHLAYGGKTPETVSRCLGRLVDSSLVIVEPPGPRQRERTYALHPVTERYVLTTARRRLAATIPGFFIHAVDRAEDDAQTGEPTFPYLSLHFPTLLAAADWFEEHLKWKKLLELQQALSRFLWVRGRWSDRVRLGKKALQAARFEGNKLLEARVLMDDLGWTTYAMGKDPDGAKAWLEKAVEIFDGLPDAYGSAKTRRHLAAVARESNDLDRARQLYAEAKTICQRIDDEEKHREMEAGLDLSLGKLALEEDRVPEAMDYLNLAIDRFRENGDSLRALKAMNFKARALVFNGQPGEAAPLLEGVIEQASTLGRPDQAALAHEVLAQIEMQLDQEEGAAAHVKQALKLHSACGNYLAVSQLAEQWPGAVQESFLTVTRNGDNDG